MLLKKTSKVGIFWCFIFSFSLLYSENLEDALAGFDDEISISTDELMEGFDEVSISKRKVKHNSALTGRVTEQVAFSYNDDSPHNNISSLKSFLLLDYEHKFENGFKIKSNIKAYYDVIYSLRGRDKYSKDELAALESEIALFDAYIEGSLTKKLDIKLGRQVVVWGRSDTIRITDVLNPLDNRRPAMVDIENLRLPVGMAKFDYFLGDWRISPILIMEQRFSFNPPSGSAFNLSTRSLPQDKVYRDFSPALSIGAEFSGWDINFYTARIRDDMGYFFNEKLQHDKVDMLGTALNVLYGSWLLKGEIAYFDGLKYTTTKQKEFKRTDALLGIEYNGIADTLIAYDASIRKIAGYDHRLKNERFTVKEETYQHAFRVSSDFMNATLRANYLISLFGSSFNEGGFQRAWVKYDIADGIYANVGFVDYIGGLSHFDAISNNDMFFMDVSYSF